MKELEIYATMVKKNGTDFTATEIQNIKTQLADTFDKGGYTIGGYVGETKPQYVAPLGSPENPKQQNLKK